MSAQRTTQPPKTGSPELIVQFDPAAQTRNTHAGIKALAANVTPIQAVLNRHDAKLQLLFGENEDRLRTRQLNVARAVSTSSSTTPTPKLPDLATFYRVHAPEDKLEQLAQDLRGAAHVKAAYVKPPTSLPFLGKQKVMKLEEPTASTTPNYQERQGYLGPAPGGIDAVYAQSLVGGKGEGVKVIDVEWGWRFTHEDLRENQGGVVSGTATVDVDYVNHGTAVAGVLGGDQNPYGITGIVPRAIFSGSSLYDQSTSAAIVAAAEKLSPGDVMLLEVQRWGPQNWTAIEWWPDDFAAISYATAKGVVVVEAAGNGNVNFDDPIYNTPDPGFPSDWKNPLNPANPSSGAVIVGAGCPPPGTHGRDNGPDRSRLWFSNYGARVDAQGWGVEVTTTAYGDLQGGVSADLWYTDTFNGTSSASPIVTGALTAVQGVLKDFGRKLLTSEQCRRLLRATGSPQQDGPSGGVAQRIGNRPDLKQLVAAALKETEWKPAPKL